MRLMKGISRRDVGLVRTMDKDMQGTWMGRRRQQEPQIRIRRLRNRRKGRGQLGRVEVDDEWVSKLHKHVWELQGIWRSLKEHTVVLNKFGVQLPVWSWVSFKQVMGIVVQISRVAEEVEKEVMQKSRSEWAQWAKQAIQKGAMLAHKVTQNRVLQSV